MKGREGWGSKWSPLQSYFIALSSAGYWSITTKANDHKEDNIFIGVFFLVGKIVPEIDLDGCQRNLVLKCAE